MRRFLLTSCALAVVATGLSACGGGGGGSDPIVVTPPSPTPPPATARLEDMFGVIFGTLFRIAANTDPTDPAAGAVIATSLTAEPVPVP